MFKLDHNIIMNIATNDLKVKIIYFLDYYLPDIYAACLTGSYVDQNFNEESDIDLWALSFQRDYVFHETFITEGLKIQVTHIPCTKVDEILWMDYFSRDGTYLGAFAKSEIIRDNNGYLFNLISRCRTIYFDGPKQMSVLELQQKKALVLNLLSDFKGSKSKQESFVILGDLLSHFSSFYMHYHKGWTNGGGRYQIRNLRKFDAQLYDSLFSLYERYFIDLDKKDLIEFFSKKFSDFEGLDEGYTVSEGMLEVKQTYLVIQVYGLTDYYDFAVNKLPALIGLVQDQIEDHLIFRTRAIGDTRINENSLYIILFASSAAVLNEKIVPLLNNFVIRYRNILANFPVNLDLSLIFSQQEIIRPITAWLSMLKKASAFEGLTETKSFVAGLEFFKLFHAVLFNHDDKEFLNFLTYVHALWFTCTYDQGRFFRVDQLILEKANMISVFANQYALQEKTLKALFSDDEFRMIPPQSLQTFPELIPALHPNQLHPTSINPVIETENGLLAPKANWIVYQNVLKFALASLFIPDNKMSYLSFSIMAIIKDKNQAPHENLAVSN
ncbi:MAG: Nucleotidyltransferase protein [Mucilaginibacter sp.]|nr:Nucleotidyltransferase protein [Mucilaginibacter sp.]